MPFAAAYPLAGVVADGLPALGAARGLRIQHRRRRLHGASLPGPQSIAQLVVHPVPGAIGAPGAEPSIGRVPGRQVMRHLTPGAATDQHVQARVEHQPAVVRQRPPTAPRITHRQQRLDHRPLRIGQRTGIRRPIQAFAHSPGPSPAGHPHRVATPGAHLIRPDRHPKWSVSYPTPSQSDPLGDIAQGARPDARMRVASG